MNLVFIPVVQTSSTEEGVTMVGRHMFHYTVEAAFRGARVTSFHPVVNWHSDHDGNMHIGNSIIPVEEVRAASDEFHRYAKEFTDSATTTTV